MQFSLNATAARVSEFNIILELLRVLRSPRGQFDVVLSEY